MRRAALPPILLAAVALAPGACGSAKKDTAAKFDGREKEVASAIDDLAAAARKGDAAKICDSYLTTDLRARLAALAKTSKRGTDCSDQLGDSIRDADSFDLSIAPGAIKITDSTATVQVKTDVTGTHDPVDTLHMTEQRGWRISQLP
jgi:hypothetical protein